MFSGNECDKSGMEILLEALDHGTEIKNIHCGEFKPFKPPMNYCVGFSLAHGLVETLFNPSASKILLSHLETISLYQTTPNGKLLIKKLCSTIKKSGRPICIEIRQIFSSKYESWQVETLHVGSG